jgi:hypothetical protein
MGRLEDLARKKFADAPLSAAEERVVQAASDGTVADCSDLGGSNDPAKADGTCELPDEKWPDTRNVRADLIRWLCIDREARQLVDPRGIQIEGARITGALDLSYIKILFALLLSGSRLEQPLKLLGAKMAALSLEGSWIEAIDGDGLHSEGDVSLTSGFHAEGEVRLFGATIGGNLDAEGGRFKNSNGDALSADGIKVTGDVFLRGGFCAEGEVRLLGAEVGGQLDCDGGRFKNSNGDALSADGIKVTGDVFLREGFSAEGEVRLLGADIGGQLEVDSAWLDLLNLDSAHIMGMFLWQNIRNDSEPHSPGKEWKTSLDLTGAKVGSLADQEASWPESGRLRLDGFVYDRIAVGVDAKISTNEKVPVDAAARLEWLRRQSDELGFRPQPYEQLISVMRQMGHEHQVAKVAIAKQKDLRRRGDLGWLGWIRSWFLYFAVGYGYRAWLAFVWLSLLIVLGSFVFSRAHSANVLVPSDKAAYEKYEDPKKRELPLVYPRFHALLYSLDVVSPFDLGQKSNWRLIDSISYWKYELYSLFQLFAGWALLIVAAAVPAGLIKKD